MSAKESISTTPTVVLVHGAFADAASWTGVIAKLEAANVDVVAPPNPLRGVATDAAYLTSFVDQIGRPALLVGHSYAGAVITQTGADASRVVGLVYVAAFAPEAGEKLADINSRYPDVPLATAQRTFPFTQDGATRSTEVYVDPDRFHEAFCADVPVEQARIMAATQRPVSLDAFTTVVIGTPAWQTLPSYSIVATSDHAIHPDAERDMAKRAGSDTVEIAASHAVAVSQPAAVANVILRAVDATA
jgi:pimeloyl-ACP methyl ester carboxylesterase